MLAHFSISYTCGFDFSAWTCFYDAHARHLALKVLKASHTCISCKKYTKIYSTSCVNFNRNTGDELSALTTSVMPLKLLSSW